MMLENFEISNGFRIGTMNYDHPFITGAKNKYFDINTKCCRLINVAIDYSMRSWVVLANQWRLDSNRCYLRVVDSLFRQNIQGCQEPLLELNRIQQSLIEMLKYY